MFYNIEDLDWKEVGRKIRNERERRGLSQAKLSRLSGISLGHIGYMEAGERKRPRDGGEARPVIPTTPSLFKICNALDIDFFWLLGVDYHPTAKAKEQAGRNLSLHGLTFDNAILLTGIRDLMLSFEGESLDADLSADLSAISDGLGNSLT